jgi:hypothetical protein
VKRKTIGENPLDQLGDLKGSKKRKLPKVSKASVRKTREIILKKAPPKSLWGRLRSFLAS